MVNQKTKIPEEIESVYQFIDGEAYRVVKGLEIEEIEISGKMVPCRRLITGHAGTKDDAIKRFLDHGRDRPDSASALTTEGVPKINTRESTNQTKNTRIMGQKTGRGRPKNNKEENNILQLSTEGRGVRDISKLTGTPRSTVSRIIAGQKSLI